MMPVTVTKLTPPHRDARALCSHNALKQPELIPDFDSHTRDGDPTDYYAMASSIYFSRSLFFPADNLLRHSYKDQQTTPVLVTDPVCDNGLNAIQIRLSGVQAIVAEWVNTLTIALGPGTVPVYLYPRHRENRGTQHGTCSRLLRPTSYDWDNTECVHSVAVSTSPTMTESLRVRQKIWDCAPGFELGDFFVCAIYLKHTGSTAEKVQDGYLQSDMLQLIQVRFPLSSYSLP